MRHPGPLPLKGPVPRVLRHAIDGKNARIPKLELAGQDVVAQNHPLVIPQRGKIGGDLEPVDLLAEELAALADLVGVEQLGRLDAQFGVVFAVPVVGRRCWRVGRGRDDHRRFHGTFVARNLQVLGGDL